MQAFLCIFLFSRNGFWLDYYSIINYWCKYVARVLTKYCFKPNNEYVPFGERVRLLFADTMSNYCVSRNNLKCLFFVYMYVCMLLVLNSASRLFAFYSAKKNNLSWFLIVFMRSPGFTLYLFVWHKITDDNIKFNHRHTQYSPKDNHVPS